MTRACAPSGAGLALAPPSAATVGALLEHGTRVLRASGSHTARLDAEVLLAATLDQRRTWLLTWIDRGVSEADVARFTDMIGRRSRLEPVAYITGRQAFYDLDLRVTPDVLIPRPETELLVEEALRWLAGRACARVLDVGTGSGAIAIAVARHAPNARVTATDLSASALQVARQNAEAHGADRIEWRCGDLFEVLHGERFDLVLSNPPYVSAQEYATLEPNVREYEPAMALCADEDGLAILRRLCAQAGLHLEDGGAMGVEIGAAQGASVRRLMEEHQFESVRVIPDLAGHDRILWGHRWTHRSSKS